MTARSVLTFGEPLVAMVPSHPGAYCEGSPLTPYAAGAELNTAVGLVRLGVEAAFAAAVGQDPWGQLLIRQARAEGIDVRWVQESEAPTALLFKQWSGLQQATSVYYYRSTSPMAQGLWDVRPLAREVAAGRYRWVHATGITWMLGAQAREAADDLLDAARTGGSTVSFDVNIRYKLADKPAWRSLVDHVLPRLDWFFLGDEEAMALFGTKAADAVERAARGLGFLGQGVVVKWGAEGAQVSEGGRLTQVPACPVPRVVDTVGAGDGFNAGFIAGLMEGWPIEQAARLGAVVGAYAVTRVGDHTGYPSRAEALAELKGTEGVWR
ncbi:sugar kinase [Alicyclobacillus kakegawensis]|uniref:sugar kinase n=1 Tax=Alicyclobacillus kakegawensis TaxID=392012 RepID=UPI000B182FA6|nr:sugar kinase [Alicyclobacillus kakegawensis]